MLSKLIFEPNGDYHFNILFTHFRSWGLTGSWHVCRDSCWDSCCTTSRPLNTWKGNQDNNRLKEMWFEISSWWVDGVSFILKVPFWEREWKSFDFPAWIGILSYFWCRLVWFVSCTKRVSRLCLHFLGLLGHLETMCSELLLVQKRFVKNDCQ